MSISLFGEAVKKGASGYLRKGNIHLDGYLVEAIRKIVKGGYYWDEEATRDYVMGYEPTVIQAKPSANNPFSPLQMEILKLMAQGLTTQQIALDLNKRPNRTFFPNSKVITDILINGEKIAMMALLGAKNAPHLIHLAWEMGLLP